MAWFKLGGNRHVSEAQGGIDRLTEMRWPDFEALIAQAYRQRGHTVELTGKGGLEGDIDLILRKDGRTELVQCKQWKTRHPGIATVREMGHVLAHRKADAVKIVSAGDFTAEATQFAKGKPIELIDGESLLELVRDVKAPTAGTDAELAPAPKAAPGPNCPRCGAAMYQRFSMQTSKMYWGCVRYPACKGSQPL